MEFTEEDKTETMGGLTRLAAQQGRWQDALEAAVEWIGVASDEGREAAAQRVHVHVEQYGAHEEARGDEPA